MTLTETIIGAAVKSAADKLLEEKPRGNGKKKAAELRERLEVLEAERLIHTVELRSELIKAAKELLPEAIRQAKPQGIGKSRRPGSPALLRLISRLAMRDVRIDRGK